MTSLNFVDTHQMVRPWATDHVDMAISEFWPHAYCMVNFFPVGECFSRNALCPCSSRLCNCRTWCYLWFYCSADVKPPVRPWPVDLEANMRSEFTITLRKQWHDTEIFQTWAWNRLVCCRYFDITFCIGVYTVVVISGTGCNTLALSLRLWPWP